MVLNWHHFAEPSANTSLPPAGFPLPAVCGGILAYSTGAELAAANFPAHCPLTLRLPSAPSAHHDFEFQFHRTIRSGRVCPISHAAHVRIADNILTVSRIQIR